MSRPPSTIDRPDIVTRDDLAWMSPEVRAGMAILRAEMAALRAEMRAEVRAEMRAEMRSAARAESRPEPVDPLWDMYWWLGLLQVPWLILIAVLVLG